MSDRPDRSAAVIAHKRPFPKGAVQPSLGWKGWMAGEALKVLFLAGRLQLDDGGWPLPCLFDRLQERGIGSQVLCFARLGEPAADRRVVEMPILKNRWLRTLAARCVWSDARLDLPDVIHVLDDEVAGLALGLSDARRLPYVQTVDGFAVLQRGLRLSRRWCRRLVVTNADLARDLVDELGVPSGRIALVPPGIPPRRDPRADDRASKVPVIGTDGALEGDAGLLAFL